MAYDRITGLDPDLTVSTADGGNISFAAAVHLMDDDIRERLYSEMAPCEPQQFYDAYCTAHRERFGEPFRIS